MVCREMIVGGVVMSVSSYNKTYWVTWGDISMTVAVATLSLRAVW